jgi:hypothetical protein
LPQSWSLQFADSAATSWPGNQFAKDGIHVIQEGPWAADRRDGAIALRFPIFPPNGHSAFVILDLVRLTLEKRLRNRFSRLISARTISARQWRRPIKIAVPVARLGKPSLGGEVENRRGPAASDIER